MQATAVEMIPAVGVTVNVQFDSLLFHCEILDVKQSWGKYRFLIRPEAGTGTQWVELSRLRPSLSEPRTGLELEARQ